MWSTQLKYNSLTRNSCVNYNRACVILYDQLGCKKTVKYNRGLQSHYSRAETFDFVGFRPPLHPSWYILNP